MKKVAVISGKGGTGKTTISAMIHAIEGDVVADCDVDAPNLHILLQPEIIKTEDFVESEKAVIDPEKCNLCGLCYELCRFEAIIKKDGYYIDEQRCEGCAFCFNACPEKAIKMVKSKTGNIYTSKTRFGYMVHAVLEPGEENSGKLASEVRERAEKIASEEGFEFVIIDSPPGVGCPVMASLTGVNWAIVVTEPTLSGLSDLIRVIDLTKHFKIKSFVVVNKYDLNESMTSKIEEWCSKNGIKFVGKIPYDENIAKSMSSLDFPFKGESADRISEIWSTIREEVA